MTLHESQERVSSLRKTASLAAADEGESDANSLMGNSAPNNIFDKLQNKKNDIAEGW